MYYEAKTLIILTYFFPYFLFVCLFCFVVVFFSS